MCVDQDIQLQNIGYLEFRKDTFSIVIITFKFGAKGHCYFGKDTFTCR